MAVCSRPMARAGSLCDLLLCPQQARGRDSSDSSYLPLPPFQDFCRPRSQDPVGGPAVSWREDASGFP